MTLTLQCKLGSILVHVDEATSPGAHEVDLAAIRSLMEDAEVVAWMKEMRKAGFLPVKRS